MDALDALTLRKRRDRLYNPNIAPYEVLRGAMYVYTPPKAVPVATPVKLEVDPPIKTEQEEVADLLQQAIDYEDRFKVESDYGDRGPPINLAGSPT